MALPYATVELLRRGYVYDPLLLAWVPGQQSVLNTGTVNLTGTFPLPANAAKEAGGNLETIAALLGIIPIAPSAVPNLNGLSVNGSIAPAYPVTIGGAAWGEWTWGAMSRVSGIASASGDTDLVVPFGTNKIRIHYMSYNPAAAVTAAFKFGSGSLFFQNVVTVGGSIIAKDNGDFRYIEGSPGETLKLNLSAAVSTAWNVFYTEIF